MRQAWTIKSLSDGQLSVYHVAGSKREVEKKVVGTSYDEAALASDPHYSRLFQEELRERLEQDGYEIVPVTLIPAPSPPPAKTQSELVLRDEFAAISLQWDMDGPAYPIEGARKCLLENRGARHSGDCTKECHTCLRCQCDEAYAKADCYLRSLERQPSEEDVTRVEVAMTKFYPNGGDDWGYVSERGVDDPKEPEDLGSYDAAEAAASRLNAKAAIAAYRGEK